MAYETQQPAGTTQALETNAAEGNGLLTPLRGFRFTADFAGLGITSFKTVSGDLVLRLILRSIEKADLQVLLTEKYRDWYHMIQ